MTLGAILLGLLLGAFGGALHLGVTWFRASLVVTQRAPFAGLLLYPLALAGPAIAVFLAAKFAPLAAWMTPIGFFLVRLIGLRVLGPKHASSAAKTEDAAR